jgi:hypothetical protein
MSDRLAQIADHIRDLTERGTHLERLTAPVPYVTADGQLRKKRIHPSLHHSLLDQLRRAAYDRAQNETEAADRDAWTVEHFDADAVDRLDAIRQQVALWMAEFEIEPRHPQYAARKPGRDRHAAAVHQPRAGPGRSDPRRGAAARRRRRGGPPVRPGPARPGRRRSRPAPTATSSTGSPATWPAGAPGAGSWPVGIRRRGGRTSAAPTAANCPATGPACASAPNSGRPCACRVTRPGRTTGQSRSTCSLSTSASRRRRPA